MSDGYEDVTGLPVRESGVALKYRKTAPVWAVQAEIPFEVRTLEGVMRGEPGDYLCEGPAGDKWPVKRAIFEATYELAPERPRDAPEVA